MEGSDVQILLELKSCCDNLKKNPKFARRITEIINKNSNVSLQYFSEHCLLSIITVLQIKDISTNIKEELVTCMRTIIQKVRITKLTQFNNIFGSLLIQIFDKTQPNKVIKFHEELKEVVILCIKDLLHQCFTDVLESLYVKENKQKLGEGILLCLTIARTEKSSTLRLAAIDAVMALCYVDDLADKSDIILQNQVADTIMAFLPGIIAGLQEISMEGEIQNHKVTVMAIRAWGRIISLIMRDNLEEDTVLSIESVMEKSYSATTDTLHNPTHAENFIKDYLKETTRNKQWFQAVAVKLHVCIQLLDKIRSHSHYKVRRELVKSIDLIFQNCFRNMKPNIIALIDHLVSLSEDESAEVSKKAHNVLNIINENYMCNYNMAPLINSLQERFYNLLTKLPTIIRWSDDNEQLACLNQFAGYLRLLGKQRLPHIMRSQAHIRRLILALVYSTVIDCSNISLLQTISIKNLDEPAYFYGSDMWKQFKFIKNSSCKEKLVTIYKLLGEFGDFRILVDTILELVLDAPQYGKELILLLNYILVSIKDTSVLHLYKEVVNFYITEEMWYLAIEVTEDTPLTQAQSNIVQCCLLTEGLGQIARHLQHNYNDYLLKTLYLVIERAGSGNGLISYIGMRSLENIAEAQQHETIGDLLRANVDYFSYHIIMKLRQVERNPGVLDVVEVVMKYSKLDFLPYLKSIVEDVFRQLSVSFDQKNTYSFLKIFYTFTVCIKTLIMEEDIKITKEESAQTTNNPSETIILSLLEYYNAKKIDEKIRIDIDEIDLKAELNIELPENIEDRNYTHSSLEDDEQKEKKLPAHIKIIIEVMKRCLHFLPLRDVQKSLIAMQILQTGLPVLLEWENELLPIVHQLWHPLIDRFNDKNVLIINRAWQLLYVLADISNDFIRNRTLREVLPSVSKFLTESCKESLNKDLGNIYKFTQTYKLQYELLSTLGLVARLLKLREQELWQILSDTQLYLSARQNPMLQTCCIKLYKDIADYNGDIVFVKCLSIWNTKITPIPSNAALDVKNLLNQDVSPLNEYYKNVNEIILYIQGSNIQC